MCCGYIICCGMYVYIPFEPDVARVIYSLFSIMKLMHTLTSHAHTTSQRHMPSSVLADCPVDAKNSGQAALHPPTDPAQTPHQGASGRHTVTRGCLPLRQQPAQDCVRQAPLYPACLDAHEGRRLGSGRPCSRDRVPP